MRRRSGMVNTLVEEFSDGHRLCKDRLQFIVEHPSGCKGDYVGKSTYFADFPAPEGMPNSLRGELAQCQLTCQRHSDGRSVPVVAK